MKFETTAVIKEIGVIEAFGDNNFQKRNVILTEQNGNFENLVCVEFSGEKLQDPERYQVGQKVKVGGFINCNEHNGRYYTGLKGSFIQNAEAEQAPVPSMGQAGYKPQAPTPQPQGVDASMAPPAQPYQAPQQAVPVPQPQTPPVSQPVQQLNSPQLFDANGQPIVSNTDIPY